MRTAALLLAAALAACSTSSPGTVPPPGGLDYSSGANAQYLPALTERAAR